MCRVSARVIEPVSDNLRAGHPDKEVSRDRRTGVRGRLDVDDVDREDDGEVGDNENEDDDNNTFDIAIGGKAAGSSTAVGIDDDDDDDDDGDNDDTELSDGI